MKIVYIYDAIARLGGAERILVDKMNYLSNEYGHKIYLITTCQGTHPLAFPLHKDIKHIDLNARFHTLYKYAFPKRIYMQRQMENKLKNKLNETIGHIEPDIITATTYYAADIACNLNCKAKKIIESHVARTHTGKNDGTKRTIISRIYRKWRLHEYFKEIEQKSNAIVTLTKGDAGDWHSDNVVTIPNITNINNPTCSPLTSKTALFAGRFTYQKGLDKMLEVWKIVVNERKDWTLKLVGEGEQKEYLIQKSQELGIADNVTFAPATKEITQEYINCSLFLFTSRFEGFGLVLAEAMQCGVPCISFDCPYGPSDIIDDGKNGYLIENGNVEKFAQATLKLMEDDELRTNMGKAAIEKSKQYLPENIMPQWIKLYNNLTKK